MTRVLVLGATLADARAYVADAVITGQDVDVQAVSCAYPDGARGLTADVLLVTPAGRNHPRIAEVLGLTLPAVLAGGAHSTA